MLRNPVKEKLKYLASRSRTLLGSKVTLKVNANQALTYCEESRFIYVNQSTGYIVHFKKNNLLQKKKEIDTKKIRYHVKTVLVVDYTSLTHIQQSATLRLSVLTTRNVQNRGKFKHSGPGHHPDPGLGINETSGF